MKYEGVENMRLAADQPGDLGEALFFSRGLGRTRGARDQWPLEVRGGAVQWLVTVRGNTLPVKRRDVSQLDRFELRDGFN